MRRRIGRELRKLFAAEMAQRLPTFRKIDKPKPGTDPKWIFDLAPDLIFFITLVSLPRSDEFVVEIGWTEGGEIGFRDNYKSSVDAKARKWGARLSQLWKYEGISELVWDIVPRLSTEEENERLAARSRGEAVPLFPPEPPVEEVLPRVGPLVQDAVDKLVEYALPVFQMAAEERGYSWPIGAGPPKPSASG